MNDTTNHPADLNATVCSQAQHDSANDSIPMVIHLRAGITRVACGDNKWLSAADGPGPHITCAACAKAVR